MHWLRPSRAVAEPPNEFPTTRLSAQPVGLRYLRLLLLTAWDEETSEAAGRLQ